MQQFLCNGCMKYSRFSVCNQPGPGRLPVQRETAPEGRLYINNPAKLIPLNKKALVLKEAITGLLLFQTDLLAQGLGIDPEKRIDRAGTKQAGHNQDQANPA